MVKRKGGDNDDNQITLDFKRSKRRQTRSESATNSSGKETACDISKGLPIEAEEDDTKSGHKVKRKRPALAHGKLTVNEERGDLFDAPPNTVLVHACNCKGYWGAGIAFQFKKRFPKAFKVCNDHCKETSKKDLPGTALLIPPQKKAIVQHFIGNLFTSTSIGKSKDPVDVILQNTGPAMKNLLDQIAAWNEGSKSSRIENIWLCRINSGIFGVPWEDTLDVLENIEVPDGDVPKEVTVITHE